MTRSVFSDNYDIFRKLLVKARKDAYLTQVELAQRIGKHQSYISKYENGERRLDVIELIEIARGLNANPAAFVEELCSKIQDRISA